MGKTKATNPSQLRIPVFLPGRALRSLRDSGFSLAAALAEPVDNSLEARANHITIRLDEGEPRSGKSRIHRIAIGDDGSGMDTEVLFRYLQIGYSTRYMRNDTIGKYGVGAKLAALNVGKRIDVWSRTDKDAVWQHVKLDLEEVEAQEELEEDVWIDQPDEKPVPEDLMSLLPSGPGTLVVWSKVDRLEEGRRAPDARALRVEVEKELSRIFRYFLYDGISIKVNDTQLKLHDPLFLMEDTWADSVLSKRHGPRGKQKAGKRRARQQHYPARIIVQDEEISVGGSIARLTVTLYPPAAIQPRGKGGSDRAKELRIPENEGAISFVRMRREISYTNVPRIFPRGVQDADRYIGIEVSFDPELDEYLGVRNVKRGVEPDGDLREQIRKRLSTYIRDARKLLNEHWGKVAKEQRAHAGEHAAVTAAAGDADKTMPKGRGGSEEENPEQILDDLARDVVGEDERERRRYLEQIRDRPFTLESVDFPGHTLVDIHHVDGQVLIRLNTRHRFYREMWEPIKEIAAMDPGEVTGEEAVRVAKRAVEALALMVIAYGKAESMHETPRLQYADLRGYWGQFTETLMRTVKGVV